ncbi:hypothetical protein [Alicycliphilus denitrificans]|uniref:hypothetical protein n=1 Tax=Alicycliphilus denitrificans TaxID=179636 RepID=UPI0001DA0B36|nr:hypothetical protein Alide_3536 [Alicycliphilus denitrificans BC]
MPVHDDSHDRRRPAEVRLTQETIDYMTLLVQQAVSEGIKGAMTEETAQQFWGAGIAVLQRQATHHAGRMVMSGITGLLRRGAVFVVLGGIVYALGGWTALAKMAKVLFTAGG